MSLFLLTGVALNIVIHLIKKPPRSYHAAGRHLVQNKSAYAVLWKSINPLLAGGCAEAEIIRTFRINTDLAYSRERVAPEN